VPEPEGIRQAFDRVQPLLADIQRYVRETLEPYCRARNYIFFDRTKDLDSLSEKLETGRYSAWSELDDLYACTIVVPVSAHEDGVLRKLDSSFDRHRVRSRSEAKKAPDVFRFDGIRWYGRLRPEAAAQRQPGVGKVLFEVQVVTAFEYAWITVTHDRVYKADNADWQKDRLAAQLKAAVEQIEVIIAAFDTAAVAVLESPWPDSEARTAIIDRCKLLFSDGLVPVTLEPKSWRRFADNFVGLIRSFQRDPEKLKSTVVSILDIMDSDLRRADPVSLPVSGSLFEYVLSIVSRTDTPGDLRRFTVVPSRELSDLYELRDIPKPFVFDGTSKTPDEPGGASDEERPASDGAAS
jgi:hypothetical protein